MNTAEITYPDELIEMLQPGTKVRLFYGEGNTHNELRHILAIVDDNQIVFKVWSYSKQVWRYYVQSLYSFWLAYRNGYFK